MKTFRLLPLPSLFWLLVSAATVPLQAQEVVQALPGTTDADALAAGMRRLATNPRDVDTLVDAARLSLRLEDVRAAATLLARAENVDPRNPRVKAGQGAILVQSERPGQALRYFAQAQAAGLDPRAFAADRGLAYDLTGEQERAQRDYRLALRDRSSDDEITRRYALSLGISGQRQRALQLLDPLVRRSDRGAWRAQAFILAMTGDVGGASRIAATMMPGGAAGLSAFFQRLPTLPAADRAFAVHFGQVRATPERLADARLAPPLSPLPREPGVALASAQPLAIPQPDRRSRRERERNARTQLAATRPLAAPVTRTPAQASTSVAARPTPPVQNAAVVLPAASAAPRAPSGATLAAVTPAPRPVTPVKPPIALVSASLPNAVIPARTGPASAALAQATPPRSTSPTQIGSVPVTATSIADQPAPDLPVSVSVAAPSPAFTITSGALPATNLAAALQPTPTLVEAREPATSVVANATPTLQPVQSAALPSAAVAPPLPRPAAGTRITEDSILARIVASLSIPAAELGIEGPERPVPAAATPAVIAPDAQAVARAEADRAATERVAATRAATDKKAADRKAAADRKVLAERKAAAAAKALADKEAAEKKKVERANPGRIWVQVAGGANEGDLPKAFAAIKAKAPGVFGSRAAWTTPLRATNRVLAGPFKTDAEARRFVNDLNKEGVGAFTFTSDAGQPVKRLGG